MSKLVLFKKEIARIFAKIFVGENNEEKYMAVPTEWSKLMKSNTVYAPTNSRGQPLPPILVEIQHTVDFKFYLRVIEYCLQMINEHHILPIVVVICINSTAQNALDMESAKNLDVPYAMQIPCSGWAKSFNLLNVVSIQPYLNKQPLDPLVAISHFFIEQKSSLESMELKDDPTIQLLFALAEDIQEYENSLLIMKQVCNQASHQFFKAKKRLMEDVKNPNCRKRTIRCLDDGIVYVNEICEKHNITLEPTDSVDSSSSSSTPIGLIHAPKSENKDWAYVDAFRKHYRDKIDWEACFNIGKEIGLFNTYSNFKSTKSCYFRAKSNRK